MDLWPSILETIRANIQLDKQTLKDKRVLKLNNMPDWELDEIEREKQYLEKHPDAIDKLPKHKQNDYFYIEM